MKKLERRISIIIPVYNAEKTIDNCLNSIVNQNYSNKEVIIVDNESTDNSLNIIKKYSKKYSFIKIYKSKSSMAGGVKNLAIKKCSGDYFIVVDSDDYINPLSLSLINDIISNKDYSLIRYNASYNEKQNEKMFITNIIEGQYINTSYLKKAIDEYIEYNKIFGPSWLYAYNREFFIKNKFKFKNKFQEDYGLTPQIILKAKNIYVTNALIYNYIYNEAGMTNKADNKLKKAIDVIYHSNLHFKNLSSVKTEIRTDYINYICETLRRKYIKLKGKEKEMFEDIVERSDYVAKYFNISSNTSI